MAAPHRTALDLEALEGDIAAQLGVVPRADIGVFVPEGEPVLFVGLELGRGLSEWLEPDAVARAVEEVLATSTEPLGSWRTIVALLGPGEMPRAEGGEPRRRRCFELWTSGQTSCVAVYRDGRRDARTIGDETPAAGAGGALMARMRDIWQDVLHRPVRPRDAFFALGGSSLAAAQIGARVQEQWGVAMGLSALFEAPTLEAFSACVEQRLATGEASAAPQIARARRDAPLPLSSAQRQLWFLWQLEKESSAYNLAGGLRIAGELSTAALQAAIDELVQRHESLRTSFLSTDGEAFQRIDPSSRVLIEVTDLTAQARPEEEAQARWAREVARPFDLTRAPLLRAALYTLGERDHLLGVTLHHVVSDGWSMGLFAAELVHLYEAHVRGSAQRLAPLPIQYPDYAAWQCERLGSSELERQLDYWRRQLSGDAPELQLPSVGSRAARPSDAGGTCRFSLPAELSEALRRLASDAEVTLSMLLLAAFKVLLYRYSGQTDLRVGVPNANRGVVATEGLIGFFVNTQVLRTDLGGSPSFRRLLGRVKTVALEAQAHAEVPFERVVEVLNPQRSLVHNPLFQVKFTLQIPSPRVWSTSSVTFTRTEPPTSTTHFDLGLDFTDWPEALEGCITYRRSSFDEASIERMVSHLGELLSEIVRDADQSIDRLSLLSKEERRTIGTWARGERVSLPRAATQRDAIQGFVELSRQRGSAPALVAGEQHWSYAELQHAAGRVARALQRRGVSPEQRVAVCGARSPELIAALLGVLEAGAAYVPLDPSWPAARRDQVLEASGARWLFYGVGVEGAAAHAGSLSIAEVLQESLDAFEPAPRAPVHPEQAAYVIYTSGSTGRPKGVVVSRGALSAYVEGVLERFDLPSSASFGMVSTLAADLGHTALFGALCSGRLLHLISNEHAANPDEFAGYMARHGVGALKIVPGHLGGLLDAARPEDVIPGVALILGGEASTWDLMDRVRRHKPAVRIFNHYGPTETTVGVLTYEVRRERAGQTVPIGRPLPHARALILDSGMNPCAVGVTGELYLGGHGVARAYHAAPALTAERFVPDPSPDFPGARLYRSGDRARHLPGGEIEFLGRGDQQVKIRGYRVELEEIGAALRRQSGVKAAVVIARAPAGDPSRARLLAYYVPDAAQPPGPDALLRALSAELPEYMWPAACVPLGSLPVTENGKLDVRSLPEPEQAPAPSAEPRTEREARLASIWADVLGRKSVGIHDNFFELGGDSILSLKLVARAAKSGIALTPKRLFEKQTIARLAIDEPLVQTPDPAPSESIPSAPRHEPLPLSHAQRRLWFLWQLDRDSTAYNVVRAVRLSGPLDSAALARSFEALVTRHETLRTRFRVVLGEARQDICAAAPIAIERVDLRPHAAEHREREARRRVAAQARRGFDLEAGPLLRVSLLELADEEHVLLIALHHIAADGWSAQVLLDDFAQIYAAECCGKVPALPALPVQYADYAVWQRDWLAGERQTALLEHWTERLGHEHPVLELPADRARPAVASQQSGRWTLELDGELLRALRALARREGTTPATLLLAVFKLLLHRYTGLVDLRVGVVTANRRSAELERVVGFFVNLLVVRTHVDPGQSFGALLRRVNAATLDAYAHQDLPFERLVEALRPERSLSHNPLFQVAFNHHAPAAGVRSAEGALQVTPLDWHDPPSQFDLILYAEEGAERLSLTFAYSRDLFELDTMVELAGHYETLLRAAVERPEAAAHCLVMASPKEQEALSSANATSSELPRGVCLHDLLARQVAQSPEAVAISDGQRTLTYAELNARSNRLARQLRALGAGPERLVGVCVERSLEMLVALLAISKSGGAYVPLDPAYPAARLAHMVKDSGLSLLVTEDRWLSHLPGGLDNVLRLDRDLGQLDRFSSADLPALTHPQNLAYCIYTSGSTGLPKGVDVTHENLVNFLTSMADQPGIDPRDRVLALTSLSFDIAGLELYLPLLAGARIVLVDRETARDARALLDTVLRERISVLQATPSTWQALARELAPGARLECKALCGGEALTPDLAERLQRHFVEVWNVYGPTETTVWSSRHRLMGSAPEPLVGTPIANTSLFALDARLGQVPHRVKGELYIGGLGVARGYHGRPGLTAERFIPNPFATQPGERMYRTGDLGQRRRGGALACLGRTDQQVKIRGHRIELGEIEARLAQHLLVSQAVVVAREGDSGKRLVAYVVPGSNAGDELPSVLREYLGEALPEYMVPGQIVLLEHLPLTANGKLDRQRLPEPRRAALEHSPAQSPHEERLGQIWQAVLKLERVSRTDNFFELGGDSIISLEVSRRARGLGLDIGARDLFQHQTLAALAKLAAERELADAPEDPATARAVTPEQRRLLDTFNGRPGHCASSWVFAADDALTVEQLERALRALVVHHDALRLRFRRSGASWQQEYASLTELERNWREEPLVQRRAGVFDLLEGRWVDELRQSLSPDHGQLFRAVWVENLLGARRIVLVGHELVMDDASWCVVLEDLQTACAQLLMGQNIELPRRTAAFEDWARRLRRSANAVELGKELGYWRQWVLATDVAAGLLGHRHRAPESSELRATLSVRLSPSLTASFLGRGCGAYQCEPDELLLTALALALHELGGEPSVLVSIEKRARAVAFDDLDVSRTVGRLTTRFPLLLTPVTESASLGEAIKSVKEQIRAVPRGGVGFAASGDASAAELGGWSSGRWPAVSFRYAGELLGAGSQPGLFGQWPHGLAIVASLDGDELQLGGTFDPGVLDGEHVQRLMQACRSRLEALVAHCSEQAAGGLTPSDVVGLALDQRALDALLDDLV